MTKPLTDEIPAGALEYVEKVTKAILVTVGRMFAMALGSDYKLVIIAVQKDDKGKDALCVVSDFEDKHEMTRIMREAAVRAMDGSMVDNDEAREPKH